VASVVTEPSRSPIVPLASIAVAEVLPDELNTVVTLGDELSSTAVMGSDDSDVARLVVRSDAIVRLTPAVAGVVLCSFVPSVEM